jgi:hypothetical protein
LKLVLLLLLLAVTAGTGITPSARAAGAGFKDLTAENPVYPYAVYLGNRGLMQGYTDGGFHPNQAITRAEMATLLVKADGLTPYQPTKPSFKDVNPNHWAYQNIEAVYKAGMIQGYQGYFRPDQAVTRAELAIMLFSLTKKPVLPVSLPAGVTDVSAGHWAGEKIAAAVDAGMIALNTPTNFGPAQKATRGQAARGLAIMLNSAPEHMYAPLSATLQPLKGEVSVTKAGGELHAISQQTVVGKGDGIITGKDGEANLIFPDGSSFLIEAGTEISIKEATGQMEIKQDGTPLPVINDVEVNMPLGKVFALLGTSYFFQPESGTSENQTVSYRERSGLQLFAGGNTEASRRQFWKEASAQKVRVKINSPWGVAGMRGTGVSDEVSGSGQTVTVADGTATVTSSSGDSVDVTAGQSTDTGPNGPPSPPAPMTPAQLQQWTQPVVQNWVQQTAQSIQDNAPIPPPSIQTEQQQTQAPSPPDIAGQITNSINDSTHNNNNNETQQQPNNNSNRGGNSNANAVAAAKGALNITYDGTASSISLPTGGANGTTITWNSSNPSIISNTGNVIRPSTGGDVEVTLTATITRGTASDTKTFPVTVRTTYVAPGVAISPIADGNTEYGSWWETYFTVSPGDATVTYSCAYSSADGAHTVSLEQEDYQETEAGIFSSGTANSSDGNRGLTIENIAAPVTVTVTVTASREGYAATTARFTVTVNHHTGTINFDRSSYSLGNVVTVTVTDADLKNSETLAVKVYSSHTDQTGFNVTLAGYRGSGVFSRDILIGTSSSANQETPILGAAPGETITAEYIDAIDAAGAENQVRSCSASVNALAAKSARIVLTWGETPWDLDSYLRGYDTSNHQLFEVYYGNRVGSDVTLDHDVTNGYGPETVTISHFDPNIVYRYWVHDYSDAYDPTTRLAASGASVTLYIADEQAQVTTQTFAVPQGTGTVWQVFDLNGATGAVTTVNQIRQNEPGPPFSDVTITTTAAPTAVLRPGSLLHTTRIVGLSADFEYQYMVDNNPAYDGDWNEAISAVFPDTAYFDNISVATGDVVHIRLTATLDALPPEVQDIPVDASDICALELGGVGIDLANGEITGTSSGMEYSQDSVDGLDDVGWHDCVDGVTGEVSFDTGKPFWIREKANIKNNRQIQFGR